MNMYCSPVTDRNTGVTTEVCFEEPAAYKTSSTTDMVLDSARDTYHDLAQKGSDRLNAMAKAGSNSLNWASDKIGNGFIAAGDGLNTVGKAFHGDEAAKEKVLVATMHVAAGGIFAVSWAGGLAGVGLGAVAADAVDPELRPYAQEKFAQADKALGEMSPAYRKTADFVGDVVDKLTPEPRPPVNWRIAAGSALLSAATGALAGAAQAWKQHGMQTKGPLNHVVENFSPIQPNLSLSTGEQFDAGAQSTQPGIIPRESSMVLGASGATREVLDPPVAESQREAATIDLSTQPL